MDPVLCLYVGAYLICTVDTKFLKEKIPRGNGTLCRLISMKIIDDATSHTHKKYYGRKVATVCAKYVEWIECKHIIKTEPMVWLEREINELTQKKIQRQREREKNYARKFHASICD